MGLNEAINKYEMAARMFDREGANDVERDCAQRYRQLVDWLRELKMYKEKDDDGK